jgi:hypothetical protein
MDPESYSKELMEELDSAIQAYLDRYPKLAALEVEISYRTTDGQESMSFKSFDLKSSDR